MTLRFFTKYRILNVTLKYQVTIIETPLNCFLGITPECLNGSTYYFEDGFRKVK